MRHLSSPVSVIHCFHLCAIERGFEMGLLHSYGAPVGLLFGQIDSMSGPAVALYLGIAENYSWMHQRTKSDLHMDM